MTRTAGIIYNAVNTYPNNKHNNNNSNSNNNNNNNEQNKYHLYKIPYMLIIAGTDANITLKSSSN